MSSDLLEPEDHCHRRFRSTHKLYTVLQLRTNLGGLGSSESVAFKTLHLRDLYNLDNANMAELFRDARRRRAYVERNVTGLSPLLGPAQRFSSSVPLTL